MTREQVLRTARFAGQVERYHTWPVHRRQSVGEHTWQVMRIWWQIFGPMLPHHSTIILWHDAGELRTGDLPFPVKSANQDIKVPLDRLEGQAVEDMGGPPAGFEEGLAEQDRLRVKVCDLIEMYEFGRDELRMGNEYAQPIVDDILDHIRKLVPRLPSEDRERVSRYLGLGRL